ncbi:MAG: DUF1318 domain-containing protein [Candidatus Omnitrophica bacterium]|nr:DUF1318 domain-containing protein [Candidatus Omnitrophota bacterium]
MKKITLITLFAIFIFGCSPKVRFESTKPIKIDVSMRIDVYQHVAKQADFIEDQIQSQPSSQPKKTKPESCLWPRPDVAYAQEEFSPKVKAAIESRKARFNELREWQTKGVIGENHKGFVELRDKQTAGKDLPYLEKLIAAENQDRLVIYQDLSQTNNISVEEAGIAYAPRIQQRAAAGTPIEIEVNGKYQWIIKK